MLFLLLPALHLPQPYHFPPQSLIEPPLVFQGWTYAIDFPATYTRDKKWNSYVRRRRWIRYRRYKSRDTWAKVGACMWPGGGAGPTAVPAVGRITWTLISALLPMHRGCHPHTGTWPLTCLLGTLWHCVSLLGNDHTGRPGQHRTGPDPGLRAPPSQSEARSVQFFLPHPQMSRSGSCVVSVTQTHLPA